MSLTVFWHTYTNAFDRRIETLYTPPRAFMPALMRRRLAGQGLVTLLVAAIFASQGFWLTAVAACYGGSVALVNSLLFAWRVAQLRQNIAQTAQEDALLLMVSLVERLLWVVLSLGVGMGWLELPPLGVVAAFGAAQMVLLVIRTKI